MIFNQRSAANICKIIHLFPYSPKYTNPSLPRIWKWYRKHISKGLVAPKNIALKFSCFLKMCFPFSPCFIHKWRPLNSAEPGRDVMERFLFLLPGLSLFIHRPCISIWWWTWQGERKGFPAGLSSDRRAMFIGGGRVEGSGGRELMRLCKKANKCFSLEHFSLATRKK